MTLTRHDLDKLATQKRIASTLERMVMLQEYQHLAAQDLPRTDRRWDRRRELSRRLWPKRDT